MIDKNKQLNLPMDNSIRSDKVRIINSDGSTSIMNKYDAIELAHSKNMNLVQIAFNPSIHPGSICKIIDYSKFKYEEKKRKKEQQKRARANKANIKEINFTIRIDDNDKKIKINHAKEFLIDGDMVKISIVLAKREMNRVEFAKNLMKNILSEFDGMAKMEGNPTFEGRFISCILKKI
jgi:translation initiation factor IF-3